MTFFYEQIGLVNQSLLHLLREGIIHVCSVIVWVINNL
jgi:hypothetical protein